MQFVSFTYPGLESILKKEILQRKFDLVKVEDSLVVFEGNESTLIKANLWLRTANKVYLLLKEAKITDFDTLFNEVYKIDWKKYIPWDFQVIVNVKSHKSQLSSTRTIQSIVQKAVYEKISGDKNYHFSENKIELRIDVFKDNVKILLDTSWEPLYKRGYRVGVSKAWLKETLAAWIILLSNCKQTTCYDPFCGSATLLIEKALIDLNIAPWAFRNFLFEKFNWIDSSLIEKERRRASTRKKEKTLNLIGSDIDEKILQIAQQNVKNAKLEKYIKIIKQDYLQTDINSCLISNPPYDKRIKILDNNIYNKLLYDLESVYCGWFITSYNVDEEFYKKFKVRILSNGWEKVKFFYK